jgi:hypothetical protein
VVPCVYLLLTKIEVRETVDKDLADFKAKPAREAEAVARAL